MDLRQQAETALARCESSGAGPHVLDIQDARGRVTSELSELDSLACAFSHLTLSTPALAEASLEELKATSDRLAGRLTYLLE